MEDMKNDNKYNDRYVFMLCTDSCRSIYMKKSKRIVTAIFFMMIILSACGGGKTKGTADNEKSKLTEEQAYDAVINYNKTIGSGYDEEVNSEGYLEYWDVSTNENGEIVVLYRSYTGAQIRYYVNSITGDTYVTELVPGIIDEEQKTDETFNARDYLTAD